MAQPSAQPSKLSSLFVRQAADYVKEHNISLTTLAQILGTTTAEVTSWFSLKSQPTVKQLEAIFRALRLVPIFVPAASRHGGVREFLDEDEVDIYDAMPDTPVAALKIALKDLQLQRVRLEKERSMGAISDEDYRKYVIDFSDAVRLTADALNKIDITQKLGSGAGADVEMLYGSDRGVGYKKDEVDRVRAAKEKAAAEKAAKEKATAEPLPHEDKPEPPPAE